MRGATVDQSSKRVLVKCTEKVSEFSITVNGKKTNVLVIDKNLALKSYIVVLNGKKSIFFSDAIVLQKDNGFDLLSTGSNSFNLDIYPKAATLPKPTVGNITENKGENIFSSCRITLPAYEYATKTKEVSERKIVVSLPQTFPAGINDVWLNIDYTGDTGMGFLNGELVADNFYNGLPWQIGLRKFHLSAARPKEMVFYFRPMQKNAGYLLDLQPFPHAIPDFGKSNSYLKIKSVSFIAQYKTTISF